MDSPGEGPRPIGWTELIAGAVAVLFGLACGWGLLSTMTSGPRLADAAARGGTGVSPATGSFADLCGAAPIIGGIRLGRVRTYGAGQVRLDPVSFSVTPAIDAADAYGRAEMKPPGCQAQELLAYYSGGTPSQQRLLAWVVVYPTPCAQGSCVTVSPVDAASGTALPAGVFAVDPG